MFFPVYILCICILCISIISANFSQRSEVCIGSVTGPMSAVLVRGPMSKCYILRLFLSINFQITQTFLPVVFFVFFVIY